MFCHIVPATYLKSWKIPNMDQSIYIFDRNNLITKGSLRSISNLSGTNFGKTNFFYLKMELCNHRSYDDLFAPIFIEIKKNYIMEYKNRIINSTGLFRTIYLSHKQDIVVKKISDHNTIKINSLNSFINSLWDDSQKRFIEDFFNKHVENKWNSFLEMLTHDNNKLLSRDNKDYLFLFISLQLYKSGKLIDEQLKQLLPFYSSIDYDANNTQNRILVDVLYNFIHDYNINNKNSNNIIYNTYLNLISLNWEYIFVINNTSDFLTSDNPIFIDNYNSKQSIIFPIYPNICLIISINSEDRIITKNSSILEKRMINNMIINNADKNLAYYKDLIDQSLYN